MTQPPPVPDTPGMTTPGPDSIAGTIRPETPAGNPHTRADASRTPGLAGLVAARVYASSLNGPHHARTTISDAIELESLARPTSRPNTLPDRATLPFYTNPARSNEVATEIALGRALDVKA